MRIPSEVNPPLNISLACDLTNSTGTDTNKRIQHHIFVDAIIVLLAEIDRTMIFFQCFFTSMYMWQNLTYDHVLF